AKALGLGGKDLYRQARAVWKTAQGGDPRAVSGVAQLDAGTKSVYAAYKDLRRRNRFAAGFRPTPYDVWAFKHDRAFGIPHPGSIPPGIVAHTLHYYTSPEALVVDPMAGGGTTLDVCQSMGRRCLAYDLSSVRPDIVEHDVKTGFPLETRGCDLIFCDPPYHTMLARRYGREGVDTEPLAAWIESLNQLARGAFDVLRPGGYFALLLANQTEKDLPAGFGYLDHAFYGYQALVAAGFLPERRISCPMDGAYLPQHVRRARSEGRMLGQVRDLVIVRKPN
ncbi:DNA methyltransferase, partial [Singulisphaera rosea]